MFINDFQRLRCAADSGEVSWDKFFVSCHNYFKELQEKPPVNSSLHHSHPHYHHHHNASSMNHSQVHRMISPPEVEALLAFVQLFGTIAKYVSFFTQSRARVCVCVLMFHFFALVYQRTGTFRDRKFFKILTS